MATFLIKRMFIFSIQTTNNPVKQSGFSSQHLRLFWTLGRPLRAINMLLLPTKRQGPGRRAQSGRDCIDVAARVLYSYPFVTGLPHPPNYWKACDISSTFLTGRKCFPMRTEQDCRVLGWQYFRPRSWWMN
jgi:hypothetical protein